MVFDWKGFLKRKHIPYIFEGKNVKHGLFNIKCVIHCPVWNNGSRLLGTRDFMRLVHRAVFGQLIGATHTHGVA